jgi:NADPH2:quinone reductase
MVKSWQAPVKLIVGETPLPAPGAGEVLIRIHTAGVNFGDTLISSGTYQIRPKLPFVPGTECAGVIEAIGEGVTTYRVGDRVAACGFVGDPRKDERIVGAFAEATVVPLDNIALVPDGLSLENAALHRSAAETAYHSLQQGRLAKGETLLVLGAAGACGFAAVQIGKWMGARIIASASSEEKRALALSAGADEAIGSNDPQWRDRVKELTAGRGLDAVFDPVGGPYTEPAFRSLTWGGRLIVVGFAAGTIPKIPTNLALLKGASLVGANLLQAQQFEPARVMANRVEMLKLAASGKLKALPVARRFPLADISEALAAAASGKLVGRVVIDVTPTGTSQ